MITTSVLILFGIGLTAAIILAVASKLLYVYEDPRIAQVEGSLAGANCGGCGYPGCSGAAQAVVDGKAGANVCVIGGPEITAAVAGIMGLEVVDTEPKIAFVDCTGGSRAEDNYHYEGILDCRAQHMLYGGSKMCPEGCLGLGTCVKACQFGAIYMGPDGFPVVNPDRCVSCGGCAQVCPRGVISIMGMTDHINHLNETSDCLAPCRQKCPGEINIPKYIDHIRCGDPAGAVMTIKDRNPLLLVCGRVCPRPCESVCRRGNVDEPIAINMLKRFAADWEMNSSTRLPVPMLKDNGRKVAIVGGGPGGLSCAYFLRRQGYRPTIFEALPKLGGQLRYGIPEYRLPKKVLDWEIDGILEMGVDVVCDSKFGTDFTLESLQEDGFEATFLAIGAWASGTLRIDGEDAPGVQTGTEFLTKVGLGVDTGIGKKVIVVGGGNTAIDAARTAVRMGAEATMLYRRTEAEMPAHDEEIEGAREEGVKFMFLAAPTQVVTGEDGRISHLEVLQMELGEPDASGRRSPRPIEGSEHLVECDTLFPAIGQKPEIDCLYDDDGSCKFETTRWRTLEADPDTLQTVIPHVFTGGDMHTGPDLVISAIGAGRKAARSIHYYLTQEDIPVAEKIQRELIGYTLFKDVEDVAHAARPGMPQLCHGEERNCTFSEVEGALSETEAFSESYRCLRCGLTCYDRSTPEELKSVGIQPLSNA